jgi:hypothetical protein
MSSYKAGVLPYVLVISLVGGILASSMMLRFYLSVKESDFYMDYYLMHRHAESALVFGMHEEQFNASKQFQTLDLEVPDDEQVNYASASWGMFRLVLCRIQKGEKTLEKAALCGGRAKGEIPSLYVCDLHQALSLAGSTHLEGVCYVPEQGLKRAYIEGQSYDGTSMIYGQQKTSKRELPTLEGDFTQRIEQLFKGEFSPEDSLVMFGSLTSDSIKHSFFRRTLIVRSNGDLHLKQGYYAGNIIFIASGKLRVAKECRLHHVLLLAKEIEIESDASDVQAFARERVVLKNKNVLKYPSVLAVLQEERTLPANFRQEEPYGVRLEEDSRLAGCLLSLRKKYDPRIRLLISLEKNSLLFGQIYAQDLAEVQGEVCGSMYCEKLYLKTNSSTYENYLLNAKISAKDLSPEFCGLMFKDVPHTKMQIDEVH